MTVGEGDNIREGSTKEKAAFEKRERKDEGAFVGTVEVGDKSSKGSSKKRGPDRSGSERVRLLAR